MQSRNLLWNLPNKVSTYFPHFSSFVRLDVNLFLDIDVEHAYIMAKALKSYREHSGTKQGPPRPMTATGHSDLQGLRGKAAYALLRERQRVQSVLSPTINGFKISVFTPRPSNQTDIHPLRHSHNGVIRIPTGLEHLGVVGELKSHGQRQVQSARYHRKSTPAARANSPCVSPRYTTSSTNQHPEPKSDPINVVTLANNNNR